MTTTEHRASPSSDDEPTESPGEKQDNTRRDKRLRGRFEWEQSEDYEVARRRYISAFWKALAATVSMSAILIFLIDSLPYDWLFILFLICVLACSGMYLWSSELDFRNERQEFEERKRLGMPKDFGNQKKDLVQRAKDGELDRAGLWSFTQDRIDYYHDIARSQAEGSYRMAALAGVIGFIAILGLGGFAAFATSGTASIAAAAVGVAGAAMSAYVGATFMKIQAEASSQFRQFFREPVEVSRLLGAERLINTLEGDQKAQAVQIIVSAMMTDTNTPSDGK